MGGDDSIFFLENLVDVLAKYDHNKYYYFGASSECILSNFWDSFNQGYGGAGFIMSFPLAKDIESCLRRCPFLKSAHHITMACIVDLGVSFSPLKGLYQIDMRGDILGLLSSHPKAPLMSLHHFDAITPIFPSMDQKYGIKIKFGQRIFDRQCGGCRIVLSTTTIRWIDVNVVILFTKQDQTGKDQIEGMLYQ
ncbi:hypothetical protein KY290_009643 [Solanum tuberosum]|uniref:Fringe n=1 Tax=Solanum tuberosum TaxID=4113 RepID=A0ABQ7VVG1_SOLTU|nr:hypothetical protein KY289_010005 [Solanum tuberosum]KAH0772506.1 hypothetical protein KY290_009643 [Solanum tuberosum]